MSETFPANEPFRIETDMIPAGVDTELAGQRSALIEQWRRGEADAETTYRSLEHLYWRNQPSANDTTRFYLRESTYMFPVEADMDQDLADRIYQEVQEDY